MVEQLGQRGQTALVQSAAEELGALCQCRINGCLSVLQQQRFGGGTPQCLQQCLQLFTLELTVLQSDQRFRGLALFSGGSVFPIFVSVGEGVMNMYLTLFLIGAVTTVTEWKQIHTSAVKKIFYAFTFPLFMFTYIPISVAAIFMKVEWKPIEHKIVVGIENFSKKKSA